MKIMRLAGIVLLSLFALITFAWAFGALWHDGPGKVFAVLNALAIPTILVFVKRRRLKLVVCTGWFALVLGWWLSLSPMNEGEWRTDVAKLAWSETDRDLVTLHDARNFYYRSEEDSPPLGKPHRQAIAYHQHRDGHQLLEIAMDGSPHHQRPVG